MAWVHGGVRGSCVDRLDTRRWRMLSRRPALQLLLQRQLPNGNFAQESITGVFNRNCMIVYPNYQNYFPMWAFARYSAKYDGR